VPNEVFVETAIKENARVIGVSSLLLSTAKYIPQLKQELVRRGRGDIRVIVGGAPFLVDLRLRDEFGADGVGRTPQDAVRLVEHADAAEARGNSRTSGPGGTRRWTVCNGCWRPWRANRWTGRRCCPCCSCRARWSWTCP